MSFLRIATLFAAVVSLFDLGMAVANLVTLFTANSHFLQSASTMQVMQILNWLLFSLAMTLFFSALFFRQKG